MIIHQISDSISYEKIENFEALGLIDILQGSYDTEIIVFIHLKTRLIVKLEREQEEVYFDENGQLNTYKIVSVS